MGASPAQAGKKQRKKKHVMRPIARISAPFPDKFGVPRQSGLAPSLTGRIVFLPAFRAPEALRGIEEYSHLWLLWRFSLPEREGWSPTVRPPRLGGNERVGVFATRSPNRPNPIGLSCVRLLSVDRDAPDGPALIVSGADLTDGTEIFDIKPYLPYTDSHPEASGGFAERERGRVLAVRIPEEIRRRLPEEICRALEEVLAQDPRPAYHDDPGRVYGFPFAGYEIRFRVQGDEVLVLSAERTGEEG